VVVEFNLTKEDHQIMDLVDQGVVVMRNLMLEKVIILQ
jgi:hypothetical protein